MRSSRLRSTRMMSFSVSLRWWMRHGRWALITEAWVGVEQTWRLPNSITSSPRIGIWISAKVSSTPGPMVMSLP
ncbi:hypothetical protein D9M71_665380 [compost metagenome]